MVMSEQNNEVFAGLELEWLFQRQVVVYRLTAVTTETVNRWVDLVEKTILAWPEDKPYLAIHDVSERGVSLQYAVLVSYAYMNIGVTPAGLKRISTIFEQDPNRYARVAIIFNSSLSGRIGKTLTHGESSADPRIEYSAFYNQEMALKWLSSSID